MNFPTTTFVYVIYISVGMLHGSFFREKRGYCPMYKVMSWSALCEQETAECNTDFVCLGDLKCCEDERCGVSKCTKPLIENSTPVRHLELCPVEGSAHSLSNCKHVETKFCFKVNCRRCCTHTTNCNPANGILLPYDRCRMEKTDPRPNITFDRTAITSGESLELRCQPQNNESLVHWGKMMNGSILTFPESMTAEDEGKLVLKISNSSVSDSGNYTCRAVHNGKTYYREVTVTVKRSGSPRICFLPFQEGCCDGKLTSFYYDVRDDACKAFKFGGCKGNDNNFPTKARCERICKGTKLKCPVSGLPRYTNCPKMQHHDCQNDIDCGYRKSCCLVGCKMSCIDPSQPFIDPRTKQLKTTERPGKTITSALKVQCGSRHCYHYAECQKDAGGVYECVCPESCNFQAMHPVCGMDVVAGSKRTYLSMCFLKIRSCRLQRAIRLIRTGRCNRSMKKTAVLTDLCQMKECLPYAHCVINRLNGYPQCLCPRLCKLTPKTVCGSDGRNYLNECMMKVSSCRKRLFVRKAHDGPCNNV